MTWRTARKSLQQRSSSKMSRVMFAAPLLLACALAVARGPVQQLAEYYRDGLPVEVEPGTKWNYSNHGIAVLRRLWGFLPLVNDLPFPFRYHFDFTRNGQPVFSVDKKTWIRDHYLIRIDDPYVDRRVVIAQAVAVDALQSR